MYSETETPEPWVRVDWFVFKASRPPLYHRVLNIPETEEELERILHVDSEANIYQEKVLRAGFNRSGVSRNNRLIERHEIAYGAYWKSYDFADSTGRQNLFEYPSGPYGSDAFMHDGGELIFTLPNGLHGYMLTDSSGDRLERGPTSIVSDPATNDRTVINGVSCMSCHYSGIINKSDEIRPFLEVNSTRFDEPEFLLAIYPGQETLDGQYAADRESYLETLRKIGIRNTTRAGEPVSGMSLRFQQEVNLRMAAAEFGIPPVQYKKLLVTVPDLPVSLGSLRVSGGSVKRDAFTSVFSEALDAISDSISEEHRVTSGAHLTEGREPDRTKLNLAAHRSIVGFVNSPDGKKIAVCDRESQIAIYDVKKGEPLATTKNPQSSASTTVCRFRADGRMLFTSDSQGIKAWNVARDGKLSEEFQYNGHTPSPFGAVTALAVSGNGKIGASLGRDGTLKIWSATDGREVASYSTGLSSHYVVCWISADGREVKVSDVRKLVICRPATGDSPVTVELPRGIPRGAAFSANGKLLAMTGTSGIVLCNGDDGRPMATLTGARGLDSHLSFAANGRLLLNLSSGGLRVWRLSDQKLLETYVSPGRLSLICGAADELACGWLEQEGSSMFLHLRALSLHRPTLAVVAKAQSSSAKRRSSRSRGKWRVEDKGEMQSGSRWKPVTVIAVNDDGTVRIHWDGWSDTWDEDVTPDRLRRPGGEQ